MHRKSFVTLMFVLLVLVTSVCSSAPSAENASDQITSGEQDGEIESVRARFKEHEARLSGMLWSLTHSYSDKKEMEAALKYFTSFMQGLHDPGSGELNKLGGLRQVKENFAAYTESPDGAVRGFAALVLGIIGDKKYAAAIAKMLDGKIGFKGELDEMRDASKGQAAIALSLMGATEYEEKVVALLKTGNDFDRSGAMTALISMGGKKHARAVVDIMLDKNAYAVDKLAPLNFLVETGAAAEYKKDLIGLMQRSFDSEQREAIMFLFVKIDAKETKPEIAKMLDTKFLKSDAAKALALMGAAEYEDKIAALLSDKEPLVRKEAALALGLLRSQKNAEAVSKLLSADEDFVRLYAAISLVLMDAKSYFSAAVPIIDKLGKEGAYLNPGDFHPFAAERAEALIKDFEVRLKTARASLQSGQ